MLAHCPTPPPEITLEDGDVPLVPHTGSWWGLQDILREHNFQEIALEGAAKWFQALVITSNTGSDWLLGFVNALSSLPLEIDLPVDVTEFDDLFNRAEILRDAISIATPFPSMPPCFSAAAA